jgi:DNA-binding LacI/PurR family transcriptional regulator
MPRRPRKPKTTIVDIADAAGVSVTTVSRILNDKPDVADDTRARVLQVMEEHGFAPHSAWQQIRSGRSRLIAMHFPPDFNAPSYHVLTAAALGCQAGGYSIRIVTSSLTDAELLGIFRSGQADGMILMEVTTTDRRATVLREHGYPFVMIGRALDNTGLSYVDVDIEMGLDLAVDHLVALGHRSIGFVASAPAREGREYGYATWALRGYEAACRRHGLTPLARLADAAPVDAAALVKQLLVDSPDMTAIVTPQESCLIGVVQAVQALDIRVPDDLSIIGLLSESLGDLATPPMTTINFPADEMGAEAARILLGHMDGTLAGPQQVLVRPELTVRGSTGAPRR